MKHALSFLAALCALASTSGAVLPVSGRPVPSMAAFDTIMTDFMNTKGITAGVLGISRNGRIEYLRAFGYLVEPQSSSDPGTPLPEAAMLRTASVVKPITAAAVRQLNAENGFGPTGLNRAVFNLTVGGVNNNGLLFIAPFGGLADARHLNIRLADLLTHQGGFNRLANPPGDVMFQERTVAQVLGIDSPPQPADTMRYMLGQALQWTPGTVSVVSAADGGFVGGSSNASPTVITTVGVHSLRVGDSVTIKNHSVNAVNTTATVATVPSDSTFTLDGVNSSGGAGGKWVKNTAVAPEDGEVSTSSNASPTTITTVNPHTLLVGDLVKITGHTVGSVNTTATVASVPSTRTFRLNGVTSTGGVGGHYTKEMDAYSNYGFMLLGEVLRFSAPGGYMNYVRSRIMSPERWIPATEFAPAHSLPADRDPREPRYIASTTGQSVFDNDPPIDVVPKPDGGFFIEAMLAHGGVIASAQAMVNFANAYHLWYENGDIGQPITAANPMKLYAHSGRLDGTNTWLQQRTDGVVFYLALNRTHFRDPDFAEALAANINAKLNRPEEFTWPDTTSDGFWVTLPNGNATAGYGGYQTPYEGFQDALNRVTDGSRLRLKAGATAWTGTITKRVRLDAPEGPVTLGR